MDALIILLFKFCAYVMFGFTMEVFFVAISNVADGSISGRDKYLEGKTYLWMVPVYGFLLLFVLEPLIAKVASYGILSRFAVYGVAIAFFEGLTGFVYDKLLGFCPWDYSSSKWKVHPRGYTKLTIIPAWGVAGLVIEKFTGLLQYLAPFAKNYFT